MSVWVPLDGDGQLTQRVLQPPALHQHSPKEHLRVVYGLLCLSLCLCRLSFGSFLPLALSCGPLQRRLVWMEPAESPGVRPAHQPVPGHPLLHPPQSPRVFTHVLVSAPDVLLGVDLAHALQSVACTCVEEGDEGVEKGQGGRRGSAAATGELRTSGVARCQCAVRAERLESPRHEFPHHDPAAQHPPPDLLILNTPEVVASTRQSAPRLLPLIGPRHLPLGHLQPCLNERHSSEHVVWRGEEKWQGSRGRHGDRAVRHALDGEACEGRVGEKHAQRGGLLGPRETRLLQLIQVQLRGGRGILVVASGLLLLFIGFRGGRQIVGCPRDRIVLTVVHLHGQPRMVVERQPEHAIRQGGELVSFLWPGRLLIAVFGRRLLCRWCLLSSFFALILFLPLCGLFPSWRGHQLLDSSVIRLHRLQELFFAFGPGLVRVDAHSEVLLVYPAPPHTVRGRRVVARRDRWRRQRVLGHLTLLGRLLGFPLFLWVGFFLRRWGNGRWEEFVSALGSVLLSGDDHDGAVCRRDDLGCVAQVVVALGGQLVEH
mmetsp:Transcript_47148/g.117616  ORF Transcript_47148/g.117616 Transcript_47148/m.117616 type:complete len:542 (+) Transcript_47148:2314-3939(+)